MQDIGLDIQDEMGRHEVGFVDNVKRIPLDNGKGCRFQANFKINKVRKCSRLDCPLDAEQTYRLGSFCCQVPGNFHISTHSAQQQPTSPNMAHIVHDVTLGGATPPGVELLGSFNPLKQVTKKEADRK